MADFRYNKMAIDFGTSNTVVAFWDEEQKDVVLHHIPDVTLPFRFAQDGREIEIPYIPSLIYYQNRHTTFIGYQVIEKMLEKSQGSFRWIKAYIASRRTMHYSLADGATVDNRTAGSDFLEKILGFATASAHVDAAACEVVFTVPVESFEYYTDWLAEACRASGIKRYRFIDESSACIFGYDTHLQPGDIYLVFDFGGGTLDVSIVRIEEQVEKGSGCRVLGKAGCRVGGRTIDGWLYADLLNRAKLHDIDARAASALFMLGVEKIKEHLSSFDSCPYDIRHKPSGLHLKGVYKRTELEDLLEKNSLYHTVQETLERALLDAHDRGADRQHIKEALMVGGTSHMPGIRRLVTTLFGSKVRFYRPYDAVARGACRYLSSDVEALYDHIQHDYAIKSYDKKSGSHRFIPLVPRGTRYPTKEDFKKITMKATRVGQRFFGIDIYEIAQKGSSAGAMGELIFDMNGGAVFDTKSRDGDVLTQYWMNEDNPTFIEAEQPAQQTDNTLFAVSFRVDSQKRLLVTVRDIHTQKLLYNDFPVVKLK